MGRRPRHEEAPRGAVGAQLADVAVVATGTAGVIRALVPIAATLAMACGNLAVAQLSPPTDGILSAARETSTAAIEPGQRDESIVRSFDRIVPDAFSANRGVGIGDCGARSVAGTLADDSGDLACAIVRADLKAGGRAEVRFPIATGAGALIADRSLHFAGVTFGEIERSFPSLADFWRYVLGRGIMLDYWSRASQVVLVEIGELEYARDDNGHPIIHHRGRVVRSFRGDWVAGEAIELVTATGDRPEVFASADVVVPDPPRLSLGFLNEHRSGPLFLDTGWLWPYGEPLSSDMIVEDLARLAVESREAQ